MAFHEGVLVDGGGMINPAVVLERTAPMLEAFEVTADPFADAKLFEQQLNRCDPRYQGDDRIPLLRQQLEGSTQDYSAEAKGYIYDGADAIEMREPESPLTGHYKRVFPIGAARRAVQDRTEYGIEAVFSTDGPVAATVEDGIDIAVSSRPLGGRVFKGAFEEIQAAGLTGGDLVYDQQKWPVEASLGRGAVRLGRQKYPGFTGHLDIVHFDDPDVPAQNVLGYALDKLNVPSGARVGAVVQQIYRISLGLDMQRIGNERGITVDVAGCPSDPRVVANRTAATYLAEVIKAVRAAQRSLL